MPENPASWTEQPETTLNQSMFAALGRIFRLYCPNFVSNSYKVFVFPASAMRLNAMISFGFIRFLSFISESTYAPFNRTLLSSRGIAMTFTWNPGEQSISNASSSTCSVAICSKPKMSISMSNVAHWFLLRVIVEDFATPLVFVTASLKVKIDSPLIVSSAFPLLSHGVTDTVTFWV